MHNHAASNGIEDVVQAIYNESGPRLLASLAAFLKYPEGASFTLPILANGKNVQVPQGNERLVIYKAIIETIGARLDR